MLRSQTIASELVKLLDDGIAPIYVLDDARRIVFCNAAWERWTGFKADEIADLSLAYHSPVDAVGASAAVAGLCPPPKVFSGQSMPGLVACRRPNGELAHRRGHFFALGDGEDESSPVLAILEARDCPHPASASVDGQDAQRSAEEDLHDCARRFRQQMAGRFGADSLIGSSPAITRARAQVELASKCDANVLIVGPTGAGKDHAAKAIHYCQSEPGPLVPLACALLEPNLLQSTLRALRLKHSASRASLGTLLLNDVDCLPAEIQATLAEMLRAAGLPMRVIATASRSLDEMARQREFSPVLAAMLSTITIELPPLERRLEDLPALAQVFLEEANAGSLKQLGGFSAEALDRLAAYPWPGNVDELASMVRESHEQASFGEVGARDLPQRIRLTADAASHPARSDETIDIEEFLSRVERELIARALRRAKGNKSKAARLLGLSRPRLYRRLVQLGFEKPDEGEENADG